MAEFVVYEDTPMEEYLRSIESSESSVKPAPLHLGINSSEPKTKTSAATQLSESLYRYWRQSLFHDTFSVSLPIMEELAFEEKFKYLIVTSPLLNDTLSIHPKQKQQQQQQQQQQQEQQQQAPPFHSTAAHTRSGRIGTVATLSGLFIALGIERCLPFQGDSSAARSIAPTVTMTLAGGMSLFFVYRHMRRSSIRKLYQCALTQLQDVMEQSQLLDSKVHKALLTIQEIELVSRGYRLSTPLSPISRIEQASKSRRCARLRTHLSGLLRRAFIVYEEAIIELTDRVNKQTLSRLFDMYNIHSVASLSAAAAAAGGPSVYEMNSQSTNNNTSNNGSDITLDYLKTLAQLMHLKRRECMLQFMALSVMTGGHDSIRKGYESGWRNINTVLAILVKDTRGFVKDVTEAMEIEFSKPTSMDLEADSDVQLTSNANTRRFVHRLSSMEQHLRTMEARVYLCNDELQKRQRLISKQVDGEEDDELEQQQRTLQKEYMAMEKDIQQFVLEWETGKHALDTLLTPSSAALDTLTNTSETLPSPLPSPTMTPTTDHDQGSLGYVVTSDESEEIFNLPLPSKASVYESVADALEKSTTGEGQIKKSRAERIAEMKQKREQEVKIKSSQLDTRTMVHELKNVLDRRVQELDLMNDNDDNTQQ